MSDEHEVAQPNGLEDGADFKADDAEREEFAIEQGEAAERLGIETADDWEVVPRKPRKPRVKLPDPTVGEGVLRLRAAEDHPVEYSFVETSKSLRGSVTASAELVKEAFGIGRGKLQLEGGRSIEVTFVALTTGDRVVYFESADQFR